MGQLGPRWGSVQIRRGYVLLPALRLVQVKGAESDYCLVVPAHYEAPVGFSAAAVARNWKLLDLMEVYAAG